jgi:hypothetical protein
VFNKSFIHIFFIKLDIPCITSTAGMISYNTSVVTSWYDLNSNRCYTISSYKHSSQQPQYTRLVIGTSRTVGSAKKANHTCCAGDTWYIQLDEEDMNKTLGIKYIMLCICDIK